MDEPIHLLNRRHALKALAGTAALSVAGCLGDDGDDDDDTGDPDDEYGERIPDPITIEYYGDVGITPMQEAMAPIITENLEDLLGVSVDIRPIAAGTLVDNAVNDRRNSHFTHFFSSMEPDRLDPNEMTRRWGVDWAGQNGRGNLLNYANCEFTQLAVDQGNAADEEERRDIVNQAHSIFSHDVAAIPTLPDVLIGAYNTEQVDIGGLGHTGLHVAANYPFLKSTPIDGDRITTNGTPSHAAIQNYIKQTAGPSIVRWGTFIHSGLAEHNEELDIVPVLAEDWDIMDDFRRIEVDLVDAPFSNGDQITADDVQFTYEHIWENPQTYPYSDPPSEYDIDVIDDESLVFEFGNPQPMIQSEFARWGIYHSEEWIAAGAEEDPEGFQVPLISSGPFEVVEWTREEYVALDPRDDHPVHDLDHGLDYVIYSEESAMIEAFLSGDLDVITEISHGAVQRIEEEFDEGETVVNDSMFPHYLAPQYPMAPCKFQEFRDAVGRSLDRSLMSELATDGEADPELTLHASVLIGEHPWRPPEDELYQFTDDVTGDIDFGREALEDAGWGWDDDGHLRYPEDADTSPLWPDGEEPSPDDFDCLEDFGVLG